MHSAATECKFIAADTTKPESPNHQVGGKKTKQSNKQTKTKNRMTNVRSKYSQSLGITRTVTC